MNVYCCEFPSFSSLPRIDTRDELKWQTERFLYSNCFQRSLQCLLFPVMRGRKSCETFYERNAHIKNLSMSTANYSLVLLLFEVGKILLSLPPSLLLFCPRSTFKRFMAFQNYFSCSFTTLFDIPLLLSCCTFFGIRSPFHPFLVILLFKLESTQRCPRVYVAVFLGYILKRTFEFQSLIYALWILSR